MGINFLKSQNDITYIQIHHYNTQILKGNFLQFHKWVDKINNVTSDKGRLVIADGHQSLA